MILPCLTANYFSDVQQVAGLQSSNKQEKLQLVVFVLPQKRWWAAFPACSKIQVKGGITRLEAQATMPLLSAVQDTAAPQTEKCSSASAFHMQDIQTAIIKATVWIKTGERKDEMENFFTFSIFCSQPLQVLLLDLAYSAAKSFRLFSALPPPSCSPPFPGEQSNYRVQP